jgi:hypothetical protein
MFYLFKIEETVMQNEDRPDLYNSDRKIKFLDIMCAFSISVRAVYFGLITYQNHNLFENYDDEVSFLIGFDYFMFGVIYSITGFFMRQRLM